MDGECTHGLMIRDGALLSASLPCTHAPHSPGIYRHRVFAAGLHPNVNPSNEATSILQKNFETRNEANKKNAIY
jgi:hypothetical protein